MIPTEDIGWMLLSVDGDGQVPFASGDLSVGAFLQVAERTSTTLGVVWDECRRLEPLGLRLERAIPDSLRGHRPSFEEVDTASNLGLPVTLNCSWSDSTHAVHARW